MDDDLGDILNSLLEDIRASMNVSMPSIWPVTYPGESDSRPTTVPPSTTPNTTSTELIISSSDWETTIQVNRSSWWWILSIVFIVSFLCLIKYLLAHYYLKYCNMDNTTRESNESSPREVTVLCNNLPINRELPELPRDNVIEPDYESIVETTKVNSSDSTLGLRHQK
jgi:hypothetical protein